MHQVGTTADRGSAAFHAGGMERTLLGKGGDMTDSGDYITVQIPRSAVTVVALPPSRWMRWTESPAGKAALRAAHAGDIISAKPGKYLLLDRESHDAWIDRHRVVVAPSPAASPTPVNDLDEALGLVPSPPRRAA